MTLNNRFMNPQWIQQIEGAEAALHQKMMELESDMVSTKMKQQTKLKMYSANEIQTAFVSLTSIHERCILCKYHGAKLSEVSNNFNYILPKGM